jgi:hypothetical protein
MSLDVMLYHKKLVSFDEGKSFEVEKDFVFEATLTHNLIDMAVEAELYEAIWEPFSFCHQRAGNITDDLEYGLRQLLVRPEHFKTFNPKNGWGTYENLVSFVQRYLEACKKYPKAEILILD